MPASGPSRSTVLASRLVTLLLILTVGFAAFFVIAGIVGAVGGDRSVAVHVEVDVNELDALPAGVISPEDVPVTLKIEDATSEQVLYSVGRDLSIAALVAAVLWLLRLIVLSVRRGDPFAAANVRRLRIIGLLLIAGVPIANLITSAFEMALASSTGVESSGVAIVVPGPALMAGLGVLVLAEVFAHGVRLREDVEGTI